MNAREKGAAPSLNLLLVDGSERTRGSIAVAMKKRGYAVTACCSVQEALRAVECNAPDLVVTELKLPDDCGLSFVSKMKCLIPDVPVIVLTSYASVATAVDAIKRGAADYLIKPSTTEQIIHALSRHGAAPALVTDAPKALSIARLEWEYINWVMHEHAGNLSAAARALSMHRRTLQRKLSKRPRSL